MTWAIQASTIDRALRRIVAEIVDGLRHGYFDFRVTCEVIGGRSTANGPSRRAAHQFVLDAESCTATKRPGDPQHADAVDTD